MKRPVLLTGATGFLGTALARRLVGEGRELFVLARRPRPTPELDRERVHWIEGDLRSEPDVRRALANLAQHAGRAGTAPDVVHAGALISYRTADAEEQRMTNVCGTRYVAEACVQYGVRRLLAVSSVVAVGSASGPDDELDEEAPFNGAALRCDYVTTKRAAEDYALASAAELEVVVVNPGAIFGPSQRPTNTLRFLETAGSGKVGPLAPPGSLSVVGLDDVVEGVLAALERGVDRRRYLLTESNWRIAELIRMIQEIMNCPKRLRGVLPAPLWGAVVLGAVVVDRFRPIELAPPQAMRLLGAHFRFDSSRARKELDWRPKPFRDVLEATISWMTRERPPASPSA